MLSTCHSYAPRKRIRPGDAFFAAGDRIALHDANTQVFFYTEEGEVPGEHTSTHDVAFTKDSNYYSCSHVGCTEVFARLEECDLHYLDVHMLECGQCHVVLPSAYLLDLHLQEEHDSFFASAASRGKASYQCLESSCSCKFGDYSTRRSHLMQTHLYPKWFRFNPRGVNDKKLSTGNHGAKQEKKRGEMHGSHHADKAGVPVRQNQDDDGRKGTNVDGEADKKCRQHQIAKKKARKERQKEARARIPCKFHSMEGGCWRGERCDFKHAIVTSDAETIPVSNSASAVEDEDMMDIWVDKRLQ